MVIASALAILLTCFVGPASFMIALYVGSTTTQRRSVITSATTCFAVPPCPSKSGWRTRNLDGYSGAIVPNFQSAEEKVEAILNWMRAEPSREIAEDLEPWHGAIPRRRSTS